MRDRLTKKRIKVDYERMIHVLGLSYEFTSYLFQKKSNISIRRSALAFLSSKKVNISFVHGLMNEKDLHSHSDLIRFANSVDLGECFL